MPKALRRCGPVTAVHAPPNDLPDPFVVERTSERCHRIGSSRRTF